LEDVSNFLKGNKLYRPLSVLFCGAGVWTQGLHFEPLHQLFFCDGFFKIGSCELTDPGLLRIMILLISASWIAKITGLNYWHLARPLFWLWRQRLIKSSNKGGQGFPIFCPRELDWLGTMFFRRMIVTGQE
jgi:hypothetical protein